MKVIQALETPRTRIRRFRAEDVDDFVQFMTTESITSNLALYEDTKSKKGAQDLLMYAIQAYDSNEPIHAYAIEDPKTQTWMGACGMNTFDAGKVEVFYALMPPFWGKGLATEILEAMTDHIFHHAEVDEIHAFIQPSNEGSKKVVLKNGFQNRGLVENSNFSRKVYLFVQDKKSYASQQS